MARGRSHLVDRPVDELAAAQTVQDSVALPPVPPGSLRSPRFPAGHDGGLHVYRVPWGQLVAVRPDSPVRRTLDDPDAREPPNHQPAKQLEMLLRS